MRSPSSRASSTTASAFDLTAPEPPEWAAPVSPAAADVEAELKNAASFTTALRSYLRRIENAAAVVELSPQRYHLLLMIRASPTPATIGNLWRLLQVPEGAMSELVRRTEAAGLIRRERSPADGRVFLLFLTTEGERRLMTAFTALRDARDQVLRDFAELDLRIRAALADPPPNKPTRAATATPLAVELDDWRSRASGSDQ